MSKDQKPNLPAPKSRDEAMQRYLATGNLAGFSEQDRMSVYQSVCDQLGLTAATRPFDFLETDNGAIVLYARRECTEQLRKIHSVSLEIVGREKIGDAYVVTSRAKTPDGRMDESTGVVSLKRRKGKDWDQQARKYRTFTVEDLVGDDLANAYMRAETKSKRRVTLSICGLGMLDESEIDTMGGAKRAAPAQTQSPLNEARPSQAQGTAPAKVAHKPNMEEINGQSQSSSGAVPGQTQGVVEQGHSQDGPPKTISSASVQPSPADDDKRIPTDEEIEKFKAFASKCNWEPAEITSLMREKYGTIIYQRITLAQLRSLALHIGGNVRPFENLPLDWQPPLGDVDYTRTHGAP